VYVFKFSQTLEFSDFHGCSCTWTWPAFPVKRYFVLSSFMLTRFDCNIFVNGHILPLHKSLIKISVGEVSWMPFQNAWTLISVNILSFLGPVSYSSLDSIMHSCLQRVSDSIFKHMLQHSFVDAIAHSFADLFPLDSLVFLSPLLTAQCFENYTAFFSIYKPFL
jgi:hypothetical protein